MHNMPYFPREISITIGKPTKLTLIFTNDYQQKLEYRLTQRLSVEVKWKVHITESEANGLAAETR